MKRYLFCKLSLGITLAFIFASCGDDDSPQLDDDSSISAFVFESLDPDVEGTISGTNITATVPNATDVTSLAPTITIADKAKVAPASGLAQDFSSPVKYMVTAEDASQSTYTVTVTVKDAPKLMASAVWEKTLANGGLPSWFTANGERDLAVSGTLLYVTNNNDKIQILSAADGSIQTSAGSGAGANKGFLDGKQNFASGNLRLANVGIDNNGVIVGSNLRVGDGTNPWNVYNWDSNTSNQELLFSYTPAQGVRMGDNMTIVGSVTGEGFIYAAGHGTRKIFRFGIAGGTVNTTPAEITLQNNDITALGNAPDVNPVSDASDANIIVTGTEIGLSEYTSAGVLVGTLPDALNAGDTAPLFAFALDVKPFELSNRKVIATTATDFTGGNNADGGWLYLIDYTDGWENLTNGNIIRMAFTPNGNIDTNLNGTGGVDVVVNNAGDQATVYAIISNFGIAAYNISFDNL